MQNSQIICKITQKTFDKLVILEYNVVCELKIKDDGDGNASIFY